MRSLIFILLASLAAAAPLFPSNRAASPQADHFPGWPAVFDERPLRPIPLTSEEIRFAGAFPGRMARFSDGKRHLLLRWVSEPTRRLHPAEECYRAWGYHLTPQPIQQDQQGRAWAVFLAEKGERRYRIRERIEGADGCAWTDASSWYWETFWSNATTGWLVVTITEDVILSH